MTPKQQFRYILGLFAVFLIVIPVIILYSFGYRMSSDFKLVKTGGIFISNNESGASVLLNGKLKKSSGILDKNMLVQNVKPGNYTVKVEKEGFRQWVKYVKIQEQLVEVCFPLLVPSELKSEEIPRYLPVEKTDLKKKGAKRPKPELNDDYIDVLDLVKKSENLSKSLFPAWNSREIAALKLGPMRRLKGKVFISNEKNKVYVKWIGKKDQLPFFINTMSKKMIYSPEKTITAIDFYPNRDDAFIVRFDDGSLYAVEIDTRFGYQNSYKIVKYCSSFLVNYEMLFYFIGNKLYSIDFSS
ncbi:MAG: hypothetical protein CVV49_12835 [Spirochaetae bacterium HGW-Spirochaetae-5]|nr:MAG: hypothetical protein CVV49_12835 [Spirochaetae bacterium HGW-Spirochaetae-5]